MHKHYFLLAIALLIGFDCVAENENRASLPKLNRQSFNSKGRAMSSSYDEKIASAIDNNDYNAFEKRLGKSLREGSSRKLHAVFCHPDGIPLLRRWVKQNKIKLQKHRDSNGDSLLHWAVTSRNTDSVRFLVEEIGINTDVKNEYGCTPLHSALRQHTPPAELLDYLLEQEETDVNAENISGLTPLAYSPEPTAETVWRLVAAGADWLENKHDQTPLSRAIGVDDSNVKRAYLDIAKETGFSTLQKEKESLECCLGAEDAQP